MRIVNYLTSPRPEWNSEVEIIKLERDYTFEQGNRKKICTLLQESDIFLNISLIVQKRENLDIFWCARDRR